MADINQASGGMDTTRLSAADTETKRRQERDQAAARYLQRKGYADLLPILGLDQFDVGTRLLSPMPEPEALVGRSRRRASR